MELVDGRKFTGIFHTATPFEGRPFEIAIKGAYRTVRKEENISARITLVNNLFSLLSPHLIRIGWQHP